MSDNGNGNPPSWDDLVNQVQGALEDLNINTPENQALFVDGLKEVMDSLEGMGFDLGVSPGSSPPSPKPEIHVFEGGKGDEPTEEEPAPPKGDTKKRKKKKADRPDLKVAPPEEGQDPTPGQSPASTPSFSMPQGWPPFTTFPGNDPESMRTLFKVLRLGEDAQGGLTGDLHSLGYQGKIHLKKEDSGFQNIFRGESPRTYRIECTQGGLQIYLNGKPAEQIVQGQSTDVEAKVIRVQASDGAGAEGIYARVVE
jgi:hypothetical protein